MTTGTQVPGAARPSLATAGRTPAPGTGVRGTRTRLRRRAAYGLIAAAALAAIALSLRPSPVEVELGTVVSGPLLVTLDAEGVTRTAERYALSAPVSGRLDRMEIREGDRVERGAVVARLTPAPIDPRSEAQAVARLASAQSLHAQAAARVEQARAAQLQAAREAARRHELAAAGALSPEQDEQATLAATLRARELDAAEAAARVAEGDVAAARATLMAARPGSASMASTSIVAPASGVVLRIPERSERVVPAGALLLEIGDAAHLEVVLDVLSTDAVSIRPGAAVLITHWGGTDTLRGTVREVEPAAFTRVSALGVEEQRVNVIADVPSPPRGLGDGYRVEGAVVVSHDAAVVKIPSSALFQGTEGPAVFVVDDGRARLRAVRVGRRAGGEAEILAGLAAGERVVRYPPDDLREGARVRAVR